MYNILLCCSAGMSTSLLVTKMKKYSESIDMESTIWAVSVNDIESTLKEREVDVILLGPQARYKLNSTKAICSEYNIDCDVINMSDYGAMNGENVFKHALTLINKN